MPQICRGKLPLMLNIFDLFVSCVKCNKLSGIMGEHQLISVSILSLHLISLLTLMFALYTTACGVVSNNYCLNQRNT